MSRVALALASGLQLGNSLSADDANSLVQLPIAAHEVEADDCADTLPIGFVDWQFCGTKANSTLREPGSTADAGRHRPRTSGYHMTEGRLKFEQIVTDGPDTLDLVITVDPGSDYECYNPSNNGKGPGGEESCFGQLNLMTGSSAVFNFAFQKANGDPHTVKNFMFTIYDVDQENDGDREFVEYIDPPVRYWTSDEVDTDNPAAVTRMENTWRFESKGRGRGVSDNPRTYDQIERSRNKRSKIIAVQYADKSNFKIRLGHTSREKQGREFLFGGRVPSFGCPPVPPTTTPAPSCPDFPAATMNWKICEDRNRPKMPKSNNLGGAGPYTDHRPELRYENVTRYNGDELDLIVVNATTYTPFRLNRSMTQDDKNDAGVSGCYGVINVNHNTSVDLVFRFVYNGQNDGPTFDANDKFVFSLWDIDHSNELGSRERVTIASANIEGELHVGPSIDKVTNDAGDYVLTSKDFGNGSDNPQDDLVSGSDGATKHVSMVLSGTNTWRVTLEAVGGQGGRNFMFYGCRSEEPSHP